LDFLNKRIESRGEGSGDLNVITGAGHHSGKGGPKIKPAVLKFLKEGGYDFKEHDDGGSTVVTL